MQASTREQEKVSKRRKYARVGEEWKVKKGAPETALNYLVGIILLVLSQVLLVQ